MGRARGNCSVSVRRLRLGVLTALCALAGGLVGAVPPATAESLPDGRVYEMVTPAQDESAEAYVQTSNIVGNSVHGIPTDLPFQAAAAGDAVAYPGSASAEGNGNAGQGGGNEYLATRLPGGGWKQVDLQPAGMETTVYEAFSSELSVAILDAGLREAAPLLAEAPGGGYNVLYTRENASGSYQALFTTTPPHRSAEEFKTYEGFGEFQGELLYAGSSADFTHHLFEANDALTAGAIDGGSEENNLYDSVGGQLHLVNVLPGGASEPDATFGGPRFSGEESAGEAGEERHDMPDLSHAISADGSRIFWTDLNSGDLYVRENDTQPESPLGGKGECTVQADACTVAVSAGPARFWGASENGTYAFYIEGGNLYRFDVETQERVVLAGKTSGTGDLQAGSKEVTAATGSFIVGQEIEGTGIAAETTITEITPGGLVLSTAATVSGSAVALNSPAEARGVVGTSEDGEYVYVVATGVLASGATAAQSNLYLIHGGETTFIATLLTPSNNEGDNGLPPFTVSGAGHFGDWQPDLGHRTAAVSADGTALVFMSKAELTGYDNRYEYIKPNGSIEIVQAVEVFLYEAGSKRLSCLSCDPQVPLANATGEVGGYLPVSFSPTYQPRVISEDGSRVFFNSTQPLVPQVTNGLINAYEWERDGAGSCEQSGGCTYLLSGGTSTDDSYFFDASSNGDDAFTETRAQLVPEDQDEGFNVYDVRVDGVRPLSTSACTGTGCQGIPPAPPIFATPASATFNGVGNLASPEKPAAKAKSKKAGKHKTKKAGKKKRKKRSHKNGAKNGKGAFTSEGRQK
jgi:hypothetical protein